MIPLRLLSFFYLLNHELYKKSRQQLYHNYKLFLFDIDQFLPKLNKLESNEYFSIIRISSMSNQNYMLLCGA